MLVNSAKNSKFASIQKLVLFLVFFFTFSPVCSGNSINLSGPAPFIDIERSSSGNWKSCSTSSLDLEITNPGNFKVAISAISYNPSAWSGKSLRVELDNSDWLLVCVTANLFRVDLVGDGTILTGSVDLARNLNVGVYPPVPLNYESRAGRNATAGMSQISITFTLMSQ